MLNKIKEKSVKKKKYKKKENEKLIGTGQII